jgi:hypothetical protein
MLRLPCRTRRISSGLESGRYTIVSPSLAAQIAFLSLQLAEEFFTIDAFTALQGGDGSGNHGFDLLSRASGIVTSNQEVPHGCANQSGRIAEASRLILNSPAAATRQSHCPAPRPCAPARRIAGISLPGC